VPLEVFDRGYRAALEILNASPERRRITAINLSDVNGKYWQPPDACLYFSQFDHLLFKSNWEWVPDVFARVTHLTECPITKSLLLAGSFPPPSRRALEFYDHISVETAWWGEHSGRNWQKPEGASVFEAAWSSAHPHVSRAFGIDTRVMRRRDGDAACCVRDRLWVGAFGDHAGRKRPHVFAEACERDGVTCLAVGKITEGSDESAQAVARMRKAGVSVREPVDYEGLRELLVSSGQLWVTDDYLAGASGL